MNKEDNFSFDSKEWADTGWTQDESRKSVKIQRGVCESVLNIFSLDIPEPKRWFHKLGFKRRSIPMEISFNVNSDSGFSMDSPTVKFRS